MATFKDNSNRDWQLSLDAPLIRQIRNECDIDLADSEGRAYGRLAADPCLLVDVLWLLVREQAQKANVTDADFGRALVGDAIERATAAMLDAIADFSPTRKAKLLRVAAQKMEQLQTAGMDLAEAKLNDPQFEAQLLANLETRVQAEIDKMTR